MVIKIAGVALLLIGLLAFGLPAFAFGGGYGHGSRMGHGGAYTQRGYSIGGSYGFMAGQGRRNSHGRHGPGYSNRNFTREHAPNRYGRFNSNSYGRFSTRSYGNYSHRSYGGGYGNEGRGRRHFDDRGYGRHGNDQYDRDRDR